MRIVITLFFVSFVAACSTANPAVKQSSSYVPPAERKLIDPEIVDGKLKMNRADWFHNFKISTVPGFCKNPSAGFLGNYIGAPEDCEKTVEKIMDFCMENVVDKTIPKVLTTIPQANFAGQEVGVCTFSAYRASIKKST